MGFTNPYPASRLTVDSTNSLVTGMQLWFPFTTGTGTSAQCILHAYHTGTLQSGASWASSDIGTVLELNGSSEVDFTSDISRNKTAVSCSAWIKPDSVSGNNFVFYEENGTNTHRTRFGLVVADGRVRCGGRDDDSDSFTNFAESNTSTVVTGVWQHVVAVFDPTGGGCKVYLDGVDVTVSSDNTGDGFPNTASLNQVIGGIGGHSSFYFDGQIQNLRVYDRALSATEVTTLYHRPWEGSNYGDIWPYSPPAAGSMTLSTDTAATSLMTNCVGWWPLTTTTGNTTEDISGQGNDATKTGAAWEDTGVGYAFEQAPTEAGLNAGSSANNFHGSNFSVSAWVWTDDVSGSTEKHVWGCWNNSNGSIAMRVRLNQVWVLHDAGYSLFAVNAVEAKKWHNILVTYDGSAFRIYIDGVFAKIDGRTLGASNTEPFYIGQKDNSTSQSFDGYIQNVRTWTRTLSADEALLLYERPWEGEASYGDVFHYDPPAPASMLPLTSDAINTDQEAWWPLTQTTGSTCTDISGSSLDGTQNGTEVWQNSELGYVHESSGTSQNYFDNCGSTSDFAFAHTTGIMTISCWIRPTATGRSFILANNDTSGANGFYFDRKNGDGMNFYMGTSGVGGTTNVSTANSTALSDGSWQHWVFVLDTGNSVAQFYKDGVAVTTTGTIAGTWTGSTRYTTALGGLRSVPNETFDGDLHNVRVWSRVLSEDEIWSIYANPWLGSNYKLASGSTPLYNYIFRTERFRRLG